ncbi:hypothetical protein GQ44DRAFT_761974 [Phaeosphaeriaceae sp. PMI808]|nr:hypothetical protein GQ44DRAFT_761974 [Phaeosphaeriaceae sp. PMI808]
MALDTYLIRRSTPGQLRDYYRNLIHETSGDQNVSGNSITLLLIEAIDRRSIAPIAFTIWLGVSKSAFAIQQGLSQKISVTIRKHSIKSLRKAFCSSKWKSTRDDLGGVEGLLNILSELSIKELRDAFIALGRCGRGKDLSEKRQYITELFMGLQPDTFPNSAFKTTDKRPVGRHCHHLIQSCTEEIVERIVSGDLKGKWEDIKEKNLMTFHPNFMRREQLRALSAEPGLSIDKRSSEKPEKQFSRSIGTLPLSFLSMEYSIAALEKLTEVDSFILEDDVFINDLVRPLMHRAVKKKVELSKLQNIVNMTIQYLDKHTYLCSDISTREADVLHLVARCWAQKPEMFEKQLRRLCSYHEFASSLDSGLVDWDDFLNGIPKHQRYALLQLCMQESTGIDIDNDEDLKKIKGNLSHGLMDALYPQDALSLFTRVRNARGDENLVDSGGWHSLFATTHEFCGSGDDPDLYHIVLLNRNKAREEARSVAIHQIENRKKKAQLAAVSEQRTFYAKSALAYSVASDDFDLYEDTLEWTKRFLRDPLVFRGLYPPTYPDELVNFLSGIPHHLGNLTESDLQTRVKSGNVVLQRLFDTACSAISEPSFQIMDWEGTLGLFQLVVDERIKGSRRLKKSLGASDEAMYRILWEDTITMLLTVEEKAHSDKHQKMKIDVVRGPFSFGRTYQEPTRTKEVSTFTFFDNLAQARDEYWQQMRDRNAEVRTLPKSLPRGLPLQHLIAPFCFDEPNLKELAPYIASRAKAVLFPDPTDVLQPIPDATNTKLTSAIGTFIDDYHYALLVYIPKSCSKDERSRRIKGVWEYAIGPLSQSRMTREESVRFWANQLPDDIKEWSEIKYTQVPRDTWPIIPEVEERNWKPFDAGRPNYPSRELGQLTYIDLSLGVHNFDNTYDRITIRTTDLSRYDNPELPAHEVDKDTIWDSARKMGEGGVLSALLYLEMMWGTCVGGILEKPFPSENDVRYPRLALDASFQGDELSPEAAAKNIRGHLDAIPPSLLSISAENMMGALIGSDSDENGTSLQEQEFANEVIKSLKTFDDKLDENPAATLTTPSPMHESPKPRVKVTTVKLLAQLLRNADFIDEELALSTLTRLLDEAKHVDSLLMMLNTASIERQERILSKLESVIPLAGNLNERSPLTENDWKIAEETFALPEYPRASLSASTPILDMLKQHFEEGKNNGEQLQVYVNRILLPTLGLLKLQTGRWVSLFLKNHGFSDTEIEIPHVPQRSDNITRLLTKSGVNYLPRTLLEEFITYLTFHINPPESIKAFNKRLRDNPSTRSNSDVQAWLSLYGEAENAITNLTNLNLFSLLEHPTKLVDDIGMTPQVIQEQFLKLFTAIISADAPLYTGITNALLNPTLIRTYLIKPWWENHGKPILSAMIAYTNTLRTLEWERNPKRTPAVLPDTFPWRLYLLDYPWPAKNEKREDRDERCKRFADQLDKLIHEIGGSMYHVKLAQLKDYLALDPVSSGGSPVWSMRKIGRNYIGYRKQDVLHDVLMRNRVVSALYLGDVSKTRLSWITTVEVLKVEVAACLMGLVSCEDGARKVVGGEVMGRVRERVEGWKSCENEDVRRFGHVVENDFLKE